VGRQDVSSRLIFFVSIPPLLLLNVFPDSVSHRLLFAVAKITTGSLYSDRVFRHLTSFMICLCFRAVLVCPVNIFRRVKLRERFEREDAAVSNQLASREIAETRRALLGPTIQ
jgi:hypothetical protein